MSRIADRSSYSTDFQLGDRVSFDGPYGGRLTGEVVRVYNTRTRYHVEVDGTRYDVDYPADNLCRE